MTDPITQIVEQYHTSGILVDAGVLLLRLVGLYDRDRISRFKNTKQFVPEDFDVLQRLLRFFARIITTPNVLTEVSNLSGQLGEPARSECFRSLAEEISVLEEHYVASSGAADEEAFARLGLTDSGIALLCRDHYPVVTTDFALAGYLRKLGIAVINFNHLRPLGWYGRLS